MWLQYDVVLLSATVAFKSLPEFEAYLCWANAV